MFYCRYHEYSLLRSKSRYEGGETLVELVEDRSKARACPRPCRPVTLVCAIVVGTAVWPHLGQREHHQFMGELTAQVRVEFSNCKTWYENERVCGMAL